MKWFTTEKDVQRLINIALYDFDVRCKTCGSGLTNFKQFSPDVGTYYFCSKKCNKNWWKNSGLLYRALDLEKI